MKHLFLYVAIFGLFFTACKTKNSSLKYTLYSCEEGIVDAIKDASEGKYELITYGLISTFNVDGFNDFYKNYILENYNIRFGLGGCIVSDGTNCYREKIEELIYEKFGDDIFEVTKLEAINEFRKTKEFIEDIKPKIDSGEIYSFRLHKDPKFLIEGKAVDFIKYLGFANFEVDYSNPINYCEISFVVEKNGVINDIHLENAETSEPIINIELMNKLKELSKWQPGIYLGEVVRSKVYFKVPLSLL
ncbi:hypothetical protein [Winogradskyella thalassocola]|uniref:TonB protein C-terminal n=1 Tax=Winogradskyella thalassocola TaxID=262004 RepID=A0A1G8GYA1_9FLAO|nr:hypothetical protein [Winogradskyella thalassocola]SDH99261.1 hypothetical protein SAMN04489796_10663 [Winogradskyella thalassocola]